MRPGPPPPPQPFPVPPRPPKRPVNRVVAGLLWLVAGVAAVAGTFFDIYLVAQPRIEQRTGFWAQKVTSNGQEVQAGQVLNGVNVVLGAALVLVGGLMVMLSRRRWAGVVVGAFGAGALLSDNVRWIMVLVSSRPADVVFTPRLGFWLTAAAVVLALVGLVVALAGNARPRPVVYPPPPPPQPRWEPQTPRFGVPVQQPPTPPAQPAQPAPPTPAAPSTPSTPPTSSAPPSQPTPPTPAAPAALEEENRTVSLPEPEPPAPGSISRKLDGNEN